MFFLLYFALGCRISEIRALYVSDYDYTNKSVDIYKQVYTRVKGGIKGGDWKIKKTKTKAGVRKVFIPNDVCEVIKKYVDELKLKDDDFLFFDKLPVSESTVRQVFDRHTELAKLPHIRLHDVRHSSLTYQLTLCKEANEVIAVAQRSGHANPNETLKTYLAKLTEQQKKVVTEMRIIS